MEITTVPAEVNVVASDSVGRLFLGANNDIYRSEDNGDTWNRVLDNPPNTGNPRLLFVDSRDYIYTVVYILPNNYTLYRSVDNGNSWTAILTYLPNCWEMTEDPTNGDLYFNTYAVRSYIFKSTDDGATFSVFYNLTGIVDHFHWVEVSPSGQIYVSTGDGAYDATIQRYNAVTSSWDILANDTETTYWQTTSIFFDDSYVYFMGDGQTVCYRMPNNGTGTKDFVKIFDVKFFQETGNNFIYDGCKVDDIYLLGTDQGQVWASWNGLNWVKLFDSGGFIFKFTRRGYPLHFTDTEMNKLYRLNIQKEDVIHLYYKKYNHCRGVVTNEENYVVEQRLWNGTNFLDLSDVGLSNVQARIKGLSRTNQILAPKDTPNAGFEWGNLTGWTVFSGSGTYGVVSVTSEDRANGTYSLRVVKGAGDSYDNLFREPLDIFTTVNRGDILLVSAYVKGSVNSTGRIYISLVNDTSGIPVSCYPGVYDLTTSWRRITAWYSYSKDTTLPVNIRIGFGSKKGIDYTVHWDSILLQKLETGITYNSGQNNDEISFWESAFIYHTADLNTENPTLTVGGQAVSHSGTLTNGTESIPQDLTGILTGAVTVSANIQGSGQAILRITGTRVLYEDSIILQGRAQNVYYGRYYGTVSLTTATSDLIALTNIQANITSLSFDGYKLVLTIYSSLGTASTTLVYVGDNGEPKEVRGASSWSYDELSKVLTITATHSDPSITLKLEWKYPGDVNGDGIVDILDLARFAKAYGATTPTDPNWDTDADINGDSIVDIIDLSIIGKNYGKDS